MPSLHLPRLDREQLGTLAGCIVRVLGDSNRTLDIITAEEIAGQAQLGHLLATGWFDHGEGRELFEDRAALPDVDRDRLRDLPETTLGGAYVRFLDRNRLDPELTRLPTPHTDDPDAAYLLTRLRQVHDLWHTLIGVGVRGHEEVLIHAFSLAQTGMPTSALIVFFGALKHMVGEARWDALHPGLLRAYALGRRAVPLLPVYWERHLDTPLDAIRARYRVDTYY